MRVVIVYRDQSDHAREAIDYRRDFTMRTGNELETLDPDSQEGAAFCRLYDVVEYPTIVAVTDDGVLQQTWRGRPLPQIDQVGYYFHI